MRQRYNLLRANLATDLDIGDTSIDFVAALQEGGVNIPTIATPNILVLKIDREIMYLTAYTAGATTGTVLRAQENTVEADHTTNTAVLNVLTKLDNGDEIIVIAISNEITALVTGAPVVTFRMPFAMYLSKVRASLTTASSSGLPTFDINEGGTTILSTKLSIDSGEKTSTTAATPAVISDRLLADDAEITIDIDVAGTGAKGAKISLYGWHL